MIKVCEVYILSDCKHCMTYKAHEELHLKAKTKTWKKIDNSHLHVNLAIDCCGSTEKVVLQP